MNLRQELLNGTKSIGIWGIGYIGFSSMANFAARGVRCLGTDVDSRKVGDINKGNLPIDNIEYWLGFNTRPFADAGMMKATTDWKELINKDIAVHLICIPTEKDGAPYDNILEDVIRRLTTFKDIKTGSPPLIIVESTLTPNRMDRVILPIFEESGLKAGTDILVGVAPRRDWFISSDKSLRTLPRVVGGTTPETTQIMAEVLGIVCETILPAKDHRHAELVKSIENAYRHVEITLANQLSMAYPGVDMREVLRLVGTKWNIGTYQPSFGTGGYCIPLSSQYVLMGTEDKDTLSILKSTIDTDQKLPRIVAESVLKNGAKKVGVLGLAYKGDLKVHTLSPAIKIVDFLKSSGIDVKVNDPYYTAEEVMSIVGVETFDFPSGLNEFDTILVVADHRQYESIPNSVLLANLKNCRLIMNNTGIWKEIDFKEHGIEHRIAGSAEWLK